MPSWTKKSKGSGFVYTHPDIAHAVVDNRGMGVHPGVYWNGMKFDSVKLAKQAAEDAQVKA